MVKSILLTDLYELTMMQVWAEEGTLGREASFDLFFRKNPFYGGYTIIAGVYDLISLLSECSFTSEQIEYLSNLDLFTEDFLNLLAKWKFKGRIYSAPEGTPVFPNEPFLRIEGPLWSAQLIETVVLNIINFQSLIATKANRICNIAGWDSVLEFGARRAQGQDGALTASKAAYLGGCASTSNLEAGFTYGIPVSGTHAHSFVMAASDELSAFRQYSKVYPERSTLLIDTYDPIKTGLPHAIQVGKEMEACGKRLSAIRIDSGDIISLAKTARIMLDDSGLSYVRIVASGDLDEYLIYKIKEENAPVDLFGVGTRLIAGYPDSSLGGVYKLSAIRTDDGRWEGRMKTTATAEKSTLPGRKQIWRAYSEEGKMIGDCIELYNKEKSVLNEIGTNSDLKAAGTIKTQVSQFKPLLILQLEDSSLKVGNIPLSKIRENVIQWSALMPSGIKRILDPDIYPVLKGQNLLQLVQNCIGKTSYD